MSSKYLTIFLLVSVFISNYVTAGKNTFHGVIDYHNGENKLMINLFWLHIKISFIENLYDRCVAYSEEACKAAGQNLGLRVGADFTFGPATTKGCYAFSGKGHVFFWKGFLW